MILLGIDQGLANVGYAVIDYRSIEEFAVLKSGVIRTPADKKLEERIGKIYDTIRALIETYNVTHMGCERFFFNPSDQTLTFRSSTIVRTNMVSGVLFLLADEHKIFIKDYVPGTIKKHLTGDGRATKEVMIRSINDLCAKQGMERKVTNDHEADALAIALKVGDEADKLKED